MLRDRLAQDERVEAHGMAALLDAVVRLLSGDCSHELGT